MKKHPQKQIEIKLLVRVLTMLFLLLQTSTLSCTAREIKLIKTGGSPLIYYNNLSPIATLATASDYISPIFDSDHQMRFTEPLPVDVNRNWTEMFRVFVESINNDPENDYSNVDYEIIIDAPDQNQSIIVGRQDFDDSQTGVDYLAKGINSITFESASHIQIHTNSSGIKSYLSLPDGFLYGSWLGHNQSYIFYEFSYEVVPATSTTPANYELFRSTVNPQVSGNEYWLPSKVNGAVVSISGTNTSMTPLKLNAIPNPNNAIYKHVYNWEMRCSMEAILTFNKCVNISVSDLDLFGNLTNMQVGGMWGDVDIQLSPRGIYLTDVEGILLSNINAHHFALDGIEFNGNSNGLTMNNCYFEYNGRQAFSWTGGIHVTANDCHFKYSGKGVVNNYGILGSSPGAGLDIEPEDCATNAPGSNSNSVCDGATSCHVAMHGIFTNCEFKNNSGCEVVNDAGCIAQAALTNDINFNICTFDDAVQGGEHNIWCKGDNITFTGCNINTNVINAGYGILPNSETIYDGCHFRDITSDGEIWDDGQKMVEITEEQDAFKRVTFRNCDFLVSHSVTSMIHLGLPTSYYLDRDNWDVVENCTFDYHYSGKPKSGFVCVKFKGNNTIKNTLNAPTITPVGASYYKVLSCQIGVIGSDDICHPNSLNFEGQVWNEMIETMANPLNVYEIGLKENGIDNGYASLNVGNAAINIIYPIAKVHVGEKASFNIKEGGSIWGHDASNTIVNDGNFILSNNSFASLHNTLIQSNNPNSFFFVGNSLSDSFHPYWTSNVTLSTAPNWFGTYNNTNASCIQGGNANLPLGTFACTSPATVYNNISTNGPFNVLYNLTNATCTGNNGNINFSIQGGTPPFTATLNNSPITFSNNLSLAAGIYTLAITDASGCTNNASVNSFSFTINEPPLLTLNTTSTTPPLCNGGSGSLQVSTIGGSGTIQFVLMPGSASNTSGNFTSLTAGNYTVTATDASSCSITTTLTITQPPALVWNTTSTTPPLCYAGTGSLQASTTGGTGTVQFVLTPGSVTNTTGNFSSLAAGNYTVMATDANSCSITTSLIITQPPALVWNTTSTTSPLCNGSNDGSLHVSTSGGTSSIQYQLMPIGTINSTGIFNSLTAGTYTAIATDANNCSISTLLTITQPTVLTFNSLVYYNVDCSNNPGSITTSASGGSGSITYSIAPNIGNQTSPGHFTGLSANTYTVTATNTSNCTTTTVVTINAPTADHCCSANASSIISGTPNLILVSNVSASSLISLYNGGIPTFTNRNLYFDGTFTVDQSISFVGCTLWFSPTGQVHLNSSTIIFDANNSILQASCDWWGGVGAYNAANKIVIQGNSTIKQSSWGVHASNNAIVDITNSNFINNGSECIKMSDITANPYLGKINHNTFTTLTNLPGPWNRTHVGIRLDNVQQINIGDLSSVTSGNTFEAMETGIYINNNQLNGTNHIGIYNNTFVDIHDELNPTSYTPYNIVTNCYTSQKGAGVYADFSGYPAFYGSIDMHATTNASQSFINCDKAIAIVGPALSASNISTENCLLGIMCSSPYNRSYRINNNHIENAHIGIEVFGRHRIMQVNNNIVTTGYGIAAPTFPVTAKSPIGIKIQYPTTVYTTGNYTVNNNSVDIKAISGIGIYNGYGANNMFTQSNTVSFSSNSVSPSLGWNRRDLIGLFNETCFGSTFDENTVYGVSNSAMAVARDTKGMYFSQGPNCKINCNKAKYTRYGFYIWGKNVTSANNVSFNKFNANKYPWYFLDNGSASAGSFGNVGSGSADNRNEFLYAGGSGIINWLNSSGFKVYRNSSVIIPDKIYTDPGLLSQFETGPLTGQAYQVIDPQLGPNYQDPCADPTFIIDPNDSINQYGEGIDMQMALAIAQDSAEYINFPVVGGWIEKQQLYAQLDADSALRYSDMDLLTFYNNYSLEPIGDIRDADLAMQVLSDSSISSTEFISRYTTALNNNYNISSPDNWVMNEQAINLMELKFERYGIDSLNDADQSEIYSLANSCPFVEGSAVYKARILWSNFEPDAVFDDRVLCIAGQNKNTDYTNVDIDSLYESQIILANNIQNISAVSTVRFNNNEKNIADVSVYPNPANQQIIISYKSASDGVFKLYNAQGEVLINTSLSNNVTKTLLSINSISNGVYYYEVEFANMKKTIGKLIILN